MINKIQDGDIIKILPFINKDGDVYPYKKYDTFYHDNKMYYDNSEKNYLKRLVYNLNKMSPLLLRKVVHERYVFNGYANGKINNIVVGRTLFSKILEYGINAVSKDHLFVKMKMINLYPSFEDSFISHHNWDPPIPEWEIGHKEWIFKNQTDYDKIIEKNNIFNKISEINTRKTISYHN